METILARVSAPEVPTDVRQWVGNDDLVSVILQKVLGGGQRAEDATEKQIFLAVLTYSYCIGLYDSSEIAERIEENPGALSYGIHQSISAAALRHFRRTERETLRETLALVLAAATHLKFPRNVGSPVFQAEAECRIDRAVRWDCWVADGG